MTTAPLSDPARALALITLRCADRVNAVATVAPNLDSYTTVGDAIVPGWGMLALLMLAGPASTAATGDIEQLHMRTRPGGDLYNRFRHRQSQLRRYFLDGCSLTDQLAHELVDGTAVGGEFAGTLYKLLTKPHPTGSAAVLPRKALEDHIRTQLATPQHELALREILTDAAHQLDMSPVYYPVALAPTVLAKSMTITRLEPEWLTTTDPTTTTDLYANIARTGGSPALPTLTDADRVVLLGDPGSGKTTILAALVAQRTRTETRGPSFYVRLPDLANAVRGGAPEKLDDVLAGLMSSFARWYASGFTQKVSENIHALFNAIRTNPHTLIALDAWDEVYDQQLRENVRAALSLLSSIPGRIVVTSRITGYTRPLPEQTEYVTDHLNQEQVDAFFTNWFAHRPGEGAARVDSARRGSREVRDLLAIPLMAGLVAFVAENDDVPTRKHALYQRYITRFLERRWKPSYQQRREPITIAQLEITATQLAWGMATTPTPTSPLGKWHDTHTASQLLARTPHHNHHLVHELLHVDGLLTLHGQPHPNHSPLDHQYRWLHRTLHEHLVGRHLAELLATEPDHATDLTRAAVLRPEWTTALQHAIGLLDSDAQTNFFDQLDVYAANGDPGNHIVRAATDLTVASLDRDHPRAQQTLKTALAQHHYRIAYQIDPPTTARYLLENVHTADWDAATQIVPLIYDLPTKDEAAVLVAIIRRTGIASRGIDDAFVELADYDRSRADQLILEHIENGISPVNYPMAGSGDALIDALEQLVANGVDFVQIDAAHAILDADRADSRLRVSRQLTPPVAHLLSLIRADPNNENDADDYREHPDSESVLNGSQGSMLALRGGMRCSSPLDNDPAASEFARIGYWLRQAACGNPPHNPPGAWTVERALNAITAILDLAGPPETFEVLIEANQAMCWLINHQTPKAITTLIRLDVARRKSEWWKRVFDARDMHAVNWISPSYDKLLSRLSWQEFWHHAEPTVKKFGWEPIYGFMAFDRWRWTPDAVNDIAEHISRHSILPTDEFFTRTRLANISHITAIAHQSTNRHARKAIADIAYNVCSPDSLEANWPHLIDAIGNPRIP